MPEEEQGERSGAEEEAESLRHSLLVNIKLLQELRDAEQHLRATGAASEVSRVILRNLKMKHGGGLPALESLSLETPSPAPAPWPSAPTVPRYYETTLFDVPGSGVELRVISVPQPAHLAARWQLSPAAPPSLIGVAEVLGIVGLEEVLADDLPLALLATQAPPPATQPPWAGASEMSSARAEARRNPRALLFCSRVALEALVPIEESAPRGTSLVTLAGQAGGAGVGLGWLATGGSPIVVLYLSVGLVLVGAATGIARGLQEGLHVKLVRWLTGEDPKGRTD